MQLVDMQLYVDMQLTCMLTFYLCPHASFIFMEHTVYPRMHYLHIIYHNHDDIMPLI